MNSSLRVACALSILLALPAAAAPRVFVSSAGTDAGACPITAPCRNFAYAITQVSADGEIIALDTAGYGPVTITQSVSIVAAPGVTALIAASSGNAITVNAGATDRITLRGLSLKSTGANNGIYFTSGTLKVENCIIDGFGANAGIYAPGGLTPRLILDGCTLRNNTLWGVLAIQGGTGASSFLTVSNCTFEANGVSIDARNNMHVAVTDSVFTANLYGIAASSPVSGEDADVAVNGSTFVKNLYGVAAGGFANGQGMARIRLSNCSITSNIYGLYTYPDGQILSRLSNGVLTNTVEGNQTDGTPTGNYSAK